MKKLLLLVLLVLVSCSEQEDDYCNSSCWTVINKQDENGWRQCLSVQY